MRKIKILDGSMLKLIAVITMIIDHTASVLLRYSDTAFLSIMGRQIDLYTAMRMIGRISFPIYAFLVVEGFLHTRNVKRYAGNLLLFALLSEIPWNLEHSGKLFFYTQNVMFTLFLGLLGIWVIREYHDDKKKEIGLLLVLMVISMYSRADYGSSGFGFIVMLYLLREKMLYQAVVGTCFLSEGLVAGAAFIPIAMYNGKRGFIRHAALKYAFYAIYPLHMLALYFIRRALIGY